MWDAQVLPHMPGFLLSGSHPGTEQASCPLLFWVPHGSSLLLDMRGLGLTSRSFALYSGQMAFPSAVSVKAGLRCSELVSGCPPSFSSTGPVDVCFLYSLWTSCTDSIKAALGLHEGLSPKQESGQQRKAAKGPVAELEGDWWFLEKYL